MCNYICCLENNLFCSNTGLLPKKQAFFSFAEWCSYSIYQQGLIAYASQSKLDLLVVANPVSYTNERDFLIIAISDWQLHWCGGKALKSHLAIQIGEWECTWRLVDWIAGVLIVAFPSSLIFLYLSYFIIAILPVCSHTAAAHDVFVLNFMWLCISGCCATVTS